VNRSSIRIHVNFRMRVGSRRSEPQQKIHAARGEQRSRRTADDARARLSVSNWRTTRPRLAPARVGL